MCYVSIHTHAHAHTRARTRAHTHTRTHTYTYILRVRSRSSWRGLRENGTRTVWHAASLPGLRSSLGSRISARQPLSIQHTYAWYVSEWRRITSNVSYRRNLRSSRRRIRLSHREMTDNARVISRVAISARGQRGGLARRPSRIHILDKEDGSLRERWTERNGNVSLIVDREDSLPKILSHKSGVSLERRSKASSRVSLRSAGRYQSDDMSRDASRSIAKSRANGPILYSGMPIRGQLAHSIPSITESQRLLPAMTWGSTGSSGA